MSCLVAAAACPGLAAAAPVEGQDAPLAVRGRRLRRIATDEAFSVPEVAAALRDVMWRLDFMGAPGARASRGNQLKPSEYCAGSSSCAPSPPRR